MLLYHAFIIIDTSSFSTSSTESAGETARKMEIIYSTGISRHDLFLKYFSQFAFNSINVTCSISFSFVYPCVVWNELNVLNFFQICVFPCILSSGGFWMGLMRTSYFHFKTNRCAELVAIFFLNYPCPRPVKLCNELSSQLCGYVWILWIHTNLPQKVFRI